MNTTVPYPIFSHREHHVRIMSFGNVLAYEPSVLTPHEPRETIIKLVEHHGIADIVWQRIPTPSYPAGRWQVVRRDYQPYSIRKVSFGKERADGITLHEPNQGMAFATRDCPVLVLWSEHGGPIAVLHCGRESLHGIDVGDIEQSVIRNAFVTCGAHWGDPRSIRGVMTMGIAAQHFPNDRYPKLVSQLVARWGPHVSPQPNQYTIDLVALALSQLEAQGVRSTHIVRDGHDTYSDTRLASKRADRGGHNLVLVSYE